MLAGTLMLFVVFLPGAARASDVLQPVSIQLSWRYQFQFAPVIAAYEFGFYRDAGLDVKIIEGGPGINAVDQVMKGKADYGIYSSALIVEYGKGRPVVALAALMQHSPVAIITDKPNINNVVGLVGKTIAVSPDTRDEIIAYLRAMGLGDENFTIIDKTKVGLANLEDADAISAYVSNEGFFTLNSERQYMLFSPRSAGIDLFGNILFTSRNNLEQNREEVEAFRAATLKGLDFALKHPAELVDIILDRYNTQHKTRQHLMYEAAKIRGLTRPDIVEPGYMSPGRWRHVADVYADLGKLPPNINLKKFIFDPHPKVDLGWFYMALTILLLVVGAVSIALWNSRRLTHRLQSEIRERLATEKKLQASESRFKDLFENNPDPCWLIDDNHFIECNRAALDTLGYPSKVMVIDKHPADLSPPFQPNGRPSREAADEMMAIALQQGMHRFEWLHQRYEGDTVLFEVTLAKYVMNGREVLYCIWHDITERKRVETMKNEFISTVSHELRTPLTSMIGSLKLMQGGAVGEMPDKAKPLVDISINNADSLLLLINDILDFSKIESGKLKYHMEPVEMNGLVSKAIANNEHYGKQLDVTYHFTPTRDEIKVFGDGRRLLQVMNNLLSNAAKFSHLGGMVNVSLASEDDIISVQVQDQGVGIPEKFKPLIFTKFSQADSSDTRNIGGSGLGLSISKSIIEAHHGSIYFNSEEGEGSTFFVTLPKYVA